MNHVIQNGTLAVEIPGDLLSTSVEAFRDQLHHILELPAVKASRPDTLRLDLRTSRLLDSAGVNFLVGIVRACQTRGMQVKTLVASRIVQRTLLLTRLDKHLDVLMHA